jgi:hypothetical protein
LKRVSPVADREALERMGVPVHGKRNVGRFSDGQRKYLEFHQGRVFLAAFLGRTIIQCLKPLQRIRVLANHEDQRRSLRVGLGASLFPVLECTSRNA